MSAKIETSIWLAIRARVETIPLDMHIAWPGEVFEAPSVGASLVPYIRVGRVSAAPIRRFIDNAKPHERTGSVIVTLVHPILNSPISLYDQYAATIAEHFKDGTDMQFGDVCVTVTSYPYVQEGYEDNGYWTVPVIVPWRCYV